MHNELHTFIERETSCWDIRSSSDYNGANDFVFAVVDGAKSLYNGFMGAGDR